MTVTYDATGAGNISPVNGATSLPWSHTIAGNAVVVLVTSWAPGTSETVTAQVGSTSMSLLASITNIYHFDNYLSVYAFGLLNPPTGAQTVSISITDTSQVVANSVSYNDVDSFGTPVTASALDGSPAMAAASSSGDMLAQIFGAYAPTTFSTYSQTQRWVQGTESFQGLATVVGDAPGATSVTFTATESGSPNTAWGGIIVPLNPIIPPYNNPNLLYADPATASSWAWEAAKQIATPSTDVVVTVYDKVYGKIGEANDHISLEAEWKRNDMGSATIVLKGSDPMVDTIMSATSAVVPITIQVGDNMRWSGRVNNYALALDAQNETLTVECIDDFAWFSRIMLWPNFLLPIEVQFPKNAIYVGPVITCILTMVAEQCFRLQSGIWELFNNALSLDLDWEAWFGTILESDGNPIDMLMTPIMVQFVNPLFDTSPWVAVQGRMDKIYDVVKDLLMNYGLSLTATLWLPGDPQPATQSMGVSFIPFAVPLTQPTILVTCVDRSGVTGPTGTFVDGLVKQVVDLQASILGQTLAPFLNPGNAYYPASLGVNIAPAFGVNFVPSWVIFNGDDINAGGAITYKLSGYAPIAHTVIGGGKSPQWMDDLINATLEFLIDAIELTVGFTGIPDDLLNGTFDDILFAFQQQENSARRIAGGPYMFPEYFTKTGASAFTLDEWFGLMQAMFDTAGYNCIQLKWANGYPYTVGRDVFLGSLVSFVRRGQLYTDYVYSIKLKDDRKTRAEIDVIVGNGKREVNPVLRVVKMITGLEEVVNSITMSS